MSDIEANKRMKQHRADMRERGFKQMSTHVPSDLVELIDRERKERGYASRGHTLAAILREWQESHQSQEQIATS